MDVKVFPEKKDLFFNSASSFLYFMYREKKIPTSNRQTQMMKYEYWSLKSPDDEIWILKFQVTLVKLPHILVSLSQKYYISLNSLTFNNFQKRKNETKILEKSSFPSAHVAQTYYVKIFKKALNNQLKCMIFCRYQMKNRHPHLGNTKRSKLFSIMISLKLNFLLILMN